MADYRAAVGTGVIDVDGLYHPIIRIACAGEKPVGETSLVNIITAEGIRGLKMRIESPLYFETSAHIVLLVYLLSVISIRKETVVVLIIGSCRETDLLAQLRIMRGLHLVCPRPKG